MIWRLLLSFLGVWWAINAFQMFACGSVSFGGTRRAVQWACYEGSGFGVPGPVAGLGILLVLAGVLYWMWRPLWSGPPDRSTPTRMVQVAEQTPKSEPRPARRPVSSAATSDITPPRKTDMNDPISVRRQCLVLLRQINQLHNDDRLTTEEFRELNTRLLDLTKV